MKKYSEREIYEIDNLLQGNPRMIFNDKRNFYEIRNDHIEIENERLKMNKKQKENINEYINEQMIIMEDEIRLKEYLKDWDDF